MSEKIIIKGFENIPTSLLHAQEEGRVVFFCGAGISMPAGLPDFKGLVDKIYEKLGVDKDPEQNLIKQGKYDTALWMLEKRLNKSGRIPMVRRKVHEILSPKSLDSSALKSHEALLKLATNRNGKTRLVTTNFDRLFEKAKQTVGTDIPGCPAPDMPIPKASRWHGIVYLHGLLPEKCPDDEMELNKLVLTSGDFGLAYLNERWAARFVTELFRGQYIVCFVGYRINDPVLRYMMDALAADKLRGESRPDAFAFAGIVDGKENAAVEARAEWEAKGVTPLLYKIPAKDPQDHRVMHDALIKWADTYHAGARGKELLILNKAKIQPLPHASSSALDADVQDVLWALDDPRAAKRFTEMDPLPPFEWFDVLFKDMYIAGRGLQKSNWTEAQRHLARWLTRHLNKPELILRIAGAGGQLHEEFAMLVSQKIEQTDGAELSDFMRALWHIALAGKLHTEYLDGIYGNEIGVYKWAGHVSQNGLTLYLRDAFRKMFAPRVQLQRHNLLSISDEPVDWDITVLASHARSILYKEGEHSGWKVALPDLLPDLDMLLRDAVALMQELGKNEDSSFIHHASISEHDQNTGFSKWTVLIDLTRDAWVMTAKKHPAAARRMAENWMREKFPLFKRMAFFAAAHESNVIPHAQSLTWLLSDECKWLWSLQTKREMFRLVVLLSPALEAAQLTLLTDSILKGPPHNFFKSDIPAKEIAEMAERMVWLRIEKIRATGALLDDNAKMELQKMQNAHPEWQIAYDERDEFSTWIESSSGRITAPTEFSRAPRELPALIKWLQAPKSTGFFADDDWGQVCREESSMAADALKEIAAQKKWELSGRWETALQAWSDEEHMKDSWDAIGPTLAGAPDAFIADLGTVLSRWLEAVSKNVKGDDATFLALCQRILNADMHGNIRASTKNDIMMPAINHPVGHVTQALIYQWHHPGLQDGQGLPKHLKEVFAEICRAQREQYRHGKAILALHTTLLYRVDDDWATEYLLPLFDWNQSQHDALTVWTGFLYSPRAYPPLLSSLKASLLDTAKHFDELKEDIRGQYADFLTFLALNRDGTFKPDELKEATRALSPDGLANAARAANSALESAGAQHVEYWENRVKPYLQDIWPLHEAPQTKEICSALAHICVSAGKGFPEAWKLLENKLQLLDNPFMLRDMLELQICTDYPNEALSFLDAVAGKYAVYNNDLQKCFDAITAADGSLANDERINNIKNRREPPFGPG
ncbi:MAG: SIR2 family protein [Alphaproteobacteria bacterium]|nr:SIR2 family protein [Alphaproteobacteria bacterium]